MKLSYPMMLALQCKADMGLKPSSEYRFHDKRRWRFDLAFPVVKFAVEVEGGIWITGRHSRGAGMEKDMEKYAEALIAGWRVLRVSPKQVKDGTALAWVKRALA